MPALRDRYSITAKDREVNMDRHTMQTYICPPKLLFASATNAQLPIIY
ncbi:MAG: hypothetical protein ACI80S_001621 [Pseudohongiellaceae bacterium]|jgi:hypothetical protein